MPLLRSTLQPPLAGREFDGGSGVRNASAMSPLSQWIGQGGDLRERLAQVASSRFGHASALDKDTLVVSAPFENDPLGGRQAGAVYVFVRRNGAFELSQRLIETTDLSRGG